jgi:hypothetical protein
MKKRIIFWVIGWIIIYVVFFKVLPYLTDKNRGCYIHKKVCDQSFSSRVIRKFVDSANHANETITFIGKDNKEEKMIFTPEFNGMYDSINEGDSIIKEKNSIYYKVIFKTTGKDTIFKFYTTCKDSLKTPH